LVQLQWDSIWNKHLHSKDLEILRKIIYYLKYDKNLLKPFCFSVLDSIGAPKFPGGSCRVEAVLTHSQIQETQIL
jgi:hypothetical protein